ncbi:MAG: serine kinase, partial [Fusobacteriaceae bacterium]
MGSQKVRNKSITLNQLITDLKLQPITEVNLEMEINTPNIYRAGYELTGFFECEMDELYNYIHIIGKKETVYLKNLPVQKKQKILQKYFSYPYPFIVLSQDTEMEDMFFEIAAKKRKQILKSPLKTTETVRE